MLWEGKSPKGNVFKPLSAGDEHWSLGFCCWTQRPHFCQCGTERKGGQRVHQHKLSTCSDQHHEGPPSEAKNPQGHPPGGSLS